MEKPKQIPGKERPEEIENEAEKNQQELLGEKPEQPLSKEEFEERQLDELYSKLDDKQNSVLKLEKDWEALKNVRESLGLPANEENIESNEAFSEVEELKSEIAEAEKEYLDVPEEAEEGEESSIENFIKSDQFRRLQEELENKREEAIEKTVKEATEEVVEKLFEDLGKAENGDKAEKLLRKKFAVFFRENIEKSEDGTTYYGLKIKRVIKPEGGEITYIEDVKVSNEFLADNQKKESEVNLGEDKPDFSKDANSELITEKEKNQIEKLSKEVLEKERKSA